MKSICWITESWAFDTDKDIVPSLINLNKYEIRWYVLCKGTETTFGESPYYRIIKIPYRYRDIRILSYYRKIFALIDVRDADIIYSSALGIPFYYPVLFSYKRKSQPLVHAAHNVIPYPVWPWQMKWYVRYIFHTNNHFQLFSKFTADYFKVHYPQKSMFYCPMTLKGYGKVTTDNYRIDKNKLNLLFFGNVVLNKRLDLLIQAVMKLPEEIKGKIHLTIAGKCNNPKPYLAQIGNAPFISVYFKRIDDCEIAELFTKHDFLVLPYQDVAQSGPHMIAYYYNLPVIASDIDGFKERVEDGVNGMLFKSKSVDDLKEKIIKAANMPNDEKSKMKENLKAFAEENFGLEKVSQKYVEYFNSIMQ